MIILEYNPETHYLDSVYAFDPQTYTQGYSIGDFDGDGKTDIVMGSIGGKVFVVENTGNNTYQNVWTSQVETNNAYLHFWTNDIDGNGKKEFWVGGDGFFSGVGKTRFTCFESNGDNIYIPVARIDFVGIFSFYAGNVLAVDVDNDGKEEIGVCMDWNFFLLKFTGTVNHHSYEIIYQKKNEFANYPNRPGEIYGGTLYDVDDDGKLELLISFELSKPEIFRTHVFVRIYKQNLPLSVQENMRTTLPSSFELSQNYPNPFNPTTSFNYSIPKPSSVAIIVYDFLGRKVSTLINEHQNAGFYSVTFDAGKLASGVYFYTIKAGSYTATKKMLLVK